MERPLTPRERVTLRMHLWICAWCAWYLEQMHMLRAALRERGAQATEAEATDIALPADARERIKRTLGNPF
jgi:hypothetical protein